MRSGVFIAAASVLAAGYALAQPVPPPEDQGKTALPRSFDLTLETGNPAIKTSEGNNRDALVAGANSFTEAQAKAQIESKGYINVSALQMDDMGIWRGTAIRGDKSNTIGQTLKVSLDYQGNVVAD